MAGNTLGWGRGCAGRFQSQASCVQGCRPGLKPGICHSTRLSHLVPLEASRLEAPVSRGESHLHPDMPGPSTHFHELFHRLGCQGVRTEEGVGVIWEDREGVFAGMEGAEPSSPRLPMVGV